MDAHPWQLVAPWYRIDAVGSLGRNRARPPILQKYAGADFANRLVREPQESLKFTNEDFVRRLGVDPDAVVTPAARGANPGEPFKLFLDIHSRFYVVVAELHCDLPGFPSADRGEVCEAGFVIRRRVPVVPDEAQEAVARNRMARERIISRLMRTARAAAKDGEPRTLADMVQSKIRVFGDKLAERKRAGLVERLTENEAEFKALVEKHGITTRLEGWLPAAAPAPAPAAATVAARIEARRAPLPPAGEAGVGRWAAVEEEPGLLAEKVHPMLPLIADPRDAAHSAAERALWFGLVPTSSGDLDRAGAPRFADNVLYEIRCFVRRRKPGCPGRSNVAVCKGEVVWSRPTSAYQLASPYDIDGGSHRPFNIAMPDLNALRDQAALGPPGRGVNARLTTPAGSGMELTTNDMGMPSGGLGGDNQQICFYFFLIFFIVAYFIFQLFLPILMLVLNLWFLLTLRLCIPPSIGLDAGIAADLSVEGEFGLDFDAGVEIDVGAGLKTYNDEGDFKADLAKTMSESIGVAAGLRGDYAAGMESALSADELAGIAVGASADFDDPPAREEIAAEPPTAERGLVYFEKVMAA